jgi:hypothetical protein
MTTRRDGWKMDLLREPKLSSKEIDILFYHQKPRQHSIANLFRAQVDPSPTFQNESTV